MNASIIVFSEAGHALGERLVSHFRLSGDTASLTRCENGGLKDWTQAHFGDGALIFVASCGIAVRAVAPFVSSKLTDPAVVVCDEAGRFAISLLSGHVGGANELTCRIAAAIGATPVVTTASELFAREQPKNLILGVGCKRGVSAGVIERAATILLWNYDIPISRVCAAASIDLKRGEAGLAAFAAAHNLPLSFYPAEELANVPGEFTSSKFVLSVTGVDNVCERAAALCGGQGRLILPKTGRDGVTVAVFERSNA